MNKFLQISSYAVCFLLLFWVGNFVGGLFEQIHEDLPGKPLPAIFAFFLQHHHLVSYMFLFPWLGFVGLPFLTDGAASYWESNRFLLRFCVFLPAELLLGFFFYLVCHLPYVRLSMAMIEASNAPLSWIETSVRGLFWLLVLLIGIAAAKRLCWPQRPPSS